MTKPKTQAIPALPTWIAWSYALLSLVLVPVFLYRPAIDVTLVPKFMVLSGLILVFSIYFLVLPKYRLPVMALFRYWPSMIWAGFILVSTLSLFVALNPWEGAFDVLRVSLSFLYLIMTTSLLIRTGSIKPFILSAIVLCMGFSAVGYYEYFIHVFRHPDLDALYNVKGLMSHKNIFSGILYMVIPLLYYSILTASSTQRIISAAALFLDLSLLLLLQTRSIWLSIAVFILISTLLAWQFRAGISAVGKQKLYHNLLLFGIVHILALALAFSINAYSINNPTFEASRPDSEAIQNIDKRVASIFDTSSANRVKRLSIWQNTLQLVKDYPVLGVGAGNWKILAPNYYQPDSDESYYHNWRRPHNDFLWMLAEKGIAGILTYLGFFVAIVLLGIQTLRRAAKENHKIILILILGGILGYCVDASFSFPYERIDLQMFLMLFTAIILWISHNTDPVKPLKDQPYRVYYLLFTILFLIAGMGIGRKMVKGEIYTNYSYTAQVTENWPTSVLAIDLGYSNWAQLDPSNNPMLWFRGHANLRQGKYKEAKADLEKALAQNPYSIATLTDLATAYYGLGEYDKAQEYFEEAIRIYPMNRFALKALGIIHATREDYVTAVQYFYRCITDQPNPELDSLIDQAHYFIYGQGVEGDPNLDGS